MNFLSEPILIIANKNFSCYFFRSTYSGVTAVPFPTVKRMVVVKARFCLTVLKCTTREMDKVLTPTWLQRQFGNWMYIIHAANWHPSVRRSKTFYICSIRLFVFQCRFSGHKMVTLKLPLALLRNRFSTLESRKVHSSLSSFWLDCHPHLNITGWGPRKRRWCCFVSVHHWSKAQLVHVFRVQRWCFFNSNGQPNFS